MPERKKRTKRISSDDTHSASKSPPVHGAARADGQPLAHPGQDWLAKILTTEAFRERSRTEPATAQLIRGAVTQLARVADAVASNAPDVPQRMAQLSDDMSELVSWLTDDPIPDHLSLQGKIRLVKEGQWQNVLPPDSLVDFLALIFAGRPEGRRKGAPRKRSARVIARRALDAKLTRRNQSWSKLAQTFCDCGSSVHTVRCSDLLRLQVRQLQAVLLSLSSREKS